MQASEFFIGVDVSKSTLSICIHGVSGRRDLGNDAASIRAWLAALPKGASIAVESTGRYHLEVVRLAHAVGHTAFVLNAHDVYFYAKALGARGKTDRTDAQLIARYLAEHHDALRPWAPCTPGQERLHELLRCRAGVACKRSSLQLLLRDVPLLTPAIADLDRQFDALLAFIDGQIDTEMSQDAALAQGRTNLQTITGIGPQGSAMLGALFSRVHFANADAVVAYSGLDPRPNDSGTKSGRRRLSKRGSPALRRQLYLAAFAASHSKALGPLYRSIKSKGFKPTQALVILARKILRIAWAVWNSGKPFDANLLAAAGACEKT